MYNFFAVLWIRIPDFGPPDPNPDGKNNPQKCKNYKVPVRIYGMYVWYHLLLEKRCKILSLGFRSGTAVLVCVLPEI